MPERSLTQAEFSQRFPEEGQEIEFKEGLSEIKIREAVCAFSNADGGTICLGVRNDGIVVGLQVSGELIGRLHRIVATVRDGGRYRIRPWRIDDRDVLELRIEQRREGFAQLPDGRVMVRRGAMNAVPLGEDLARLVTLKSRVRFESRPSSRELTDIDADVARTVADAFGWAEAPAIDRLREQGLIASETTDRDRLTVAGTLCLTRDPATDLGKAYVEVFRYRAGAAAFDRRVELRGPVQRQIEKATRLIMDEIGIDMVVVGTRRHELPRIPEPVVREGVANAVAHRSYEIDRQPTRIEIHPDFVTITSPGGLPEPVTVENLRDQSAPRNPSLIRVLRHLRLAEDAGLGIDVMQDQMAAHLLEPPQFSSDETRVQVTLRIGSTVTPEERAWVAEIEARGEIGPHERLILVHLARGESMTNSQARRLISADSTQARRSLQRLRNAGLVVQVGERAGTRYALADGLQPPKGLGLSDHERMELILAMAQDGPVTNELVRERTGLDRARVLGLLSQLTARDALIRTGSRRGTKYELAVDPHDP